MIILVVILGNTPRLRELQILTFPNGNEVRIMEKVTPEWAKVAIALGFNGAKIRTIKMGAHYQPEEACLEMFTDWLDGGHDLEPPTWDVLIQSLNAANLINLANLLSTTIDIVSTSVTYSIMGASIRELVCMILDTYRVCVEYNIMILLALWACAILLRQRTHTPQVLSVSETFHCSLSSILWLTCKVSSKRQAGTDKACSWHCDMLRLNLTSFEFPSSPLTALSGSGSLSLPSLSSSLSAMLEPTSLFFG